MRDVFSLVFRCCRRRRPRALFPTVYTGEWVDSDSDANDLPDAGEEVAYTITVTNEGTVTLKNVVASSTGGSIVCAEDVAQPVAELGVDQSYECTTSVEVRAFFLSVPVLCGLAADKAGLAPL